MGRRDMAKPRRRPNMTEKLAACLCEIQRGGVWLIPEPLRMTGTAKEIVAAVQWDHATPWTWTQDNRPQNLTPMARAEHAEKTRKQRPAINKVRRGVKKRRGVCKPKRVMPGSKASGWRRRMDGRVERRVP
jgi:hypothetical protein